LERGEIWKYICTANITQTTTNTAPATGKFGSRVLTASATATVVLASTNLSIKVKKTATPEQVFADSGQVVYSYEVTNPGIYTLQNITLMDDKCSQVNYAIGDTNVNSQLEPGEIWRYICNANLTETTTNTATARGQSGGNYVTDVASVTVIVGKDTRPSVVIPKALPNTGAGGSANNLGWNWLLSPFAFLGLAISKKKIFKKTSLNN
jgi:CO dehydrogenase/acetyl-CoA synthase gamma subunit (corrinoid Fe-S protein)